MKKDYIKYISSLLLFGSNGIIASLIALSSAETVFWRTMIGSILLIAIFLFGKSDIQFTQNKSDMILSYYLEFQWVSAGFSCMKHTTSSALACPPSHTIADLLS